VIVAWGDGIFPTLPGNPASPTVRLYQKLKQVSRMLGRFPVNHPLAGQQRLIVLKINEHLTSQIPSCWISGERVEQHPPLPPNQFLQNNPLPPRSRLREVDPNQPIWDVKQCPHQCGTVWNRDVNACR